MPVVLQGLGLDLQRVGGQPLIKIGADRDQVPLDVLARPGADAGLVTCSLSLCLGSEPSDPARPAHSTVRIVDPDDVRPGATALHEPVPKLGRPFASHHAASSFNRAMMYASRAVSGMRREPSIRTEAIVPAA